MTVILVAVAMLWVSIGGQRPSGTSAPTQGTVDYQDGDSALRALLD